MPYFKWQGIDLVGKIRNGKIFARSFEHLDSLLLKRDIALMNYKETKPLFVRLIGLQDKINFFERLSVLLESGVLLPQALLIIAESIQHPFLQKIILDLEKRVQAGQSLHEALLNYSSHFGSMSIHMIRVGFEVGKLPLVLKILVMHLNTGNKFLKKIRSAAFVPFLTLLFFVSITLVIFVAIMPLFSSIFESMQQEVPAMTLLLMKVSSFLRSSSAIIAVIIILMVSLFIYFWLGRERRKKLLDCFMIKTPVFSHLVVLASNFTFFQSVAILLDGGMQLVPALKIGVDTISNHIIRAQFIPIIKSVDSGSSLSQAISMFQQRFSQTDIEAMILVGQESGQLSAMLSRIAQDYKEKAERKLFLYSSLFQPIIMIMLGIFVALLIVAVYIPILTLSSAIS